MALSGPTPAPSWEEEECLDYYGMLSLHRMFEVVGGQLTECELDLLAFLLDEAPGAPGGLARARSGLELLLELERRGQCDESNLRLLSQLLRVLARHDLLPHLACKRRRPGERGGGGEDFRDQRVPRADPSNPKGSGHGLGRSELVLFGLVENDCGHCSWNFLCQAEVNFSCMNLIAPHRTRKTTGSEPLSTLAGCENCILFCQPQRNDSQDAGSVKLALEEDSVTNK